MHNHLAAPMHIVVDAAAVDAAFAMHDMAFLIHFSCSQTRVSISLIEWTNGLVWNIWTLLLFLCNTISDFLAYAYPSASYPHLSSTTHTDEYGAGKSINEPIASYVPHGHEETPDHASCTEVFGDRHSSFRYGEDQSPHELPSALIKIWIVAHSRGCACMLTKLIS